MSCAWTLRLVALGFKSCAWARGFAEELFGLIVISVCGYFDMEIDGRFCLTAGGSWWFPQNFRKG